MFGSECDLKMYVLNLECPLPLQIGNPTIFSTTSQLNAKLNGLYFG